MVTWHEQAEAWDDEFGDDDDPIDHGYYEDFDDDEPSDVELADDVDEPWPDDGDD